MENFFRPTPLVSYSSLVTKLTKDTSPVTIHDVLHEHADTWRREKAIRVHNSSQRPKNNRRTSKDKSPKRSSSWTKALAKRPGTNLHRQFKFDTGESYLKKLFVESFRPPQQTIMNFKHRPPRVDVGKLQNRYKLNLGRTEYQNGNRDQFRFSSASKSPNLKSNDQSTNTRSSSMIGNRK